MLGTVVTHIPAAASVPVSVGFGWSQILLAILAVLQTATLLFMRNRPKMAALKNAADESQMERMGDRIAALEAAAAELALRAEKERKQHEMALQIERHTVAHISACLDALLLLIEQDPSKASAAATRIREMRHEQVKAEGTERAAMVGAVFKGEEKPT